MEPFKLLDRLPNETLELVLSHLDLISTSNLRLTSTSLADRAIGPTYKAYFAHQETDLSEESLNHLFELTSHARLGPAVTTLTVTAVFYDDARWKHARRILRTADPHPSHPVDRALQRRAAQALSEAYTPEWGAARWAREVAEQCEVMDDHRRSIFARDANDLTERLASILSQLLTTPDGPAVRLEARVIDQLDPLQKYPRALLPRDSGWNLLWALCARTLRIVTGAIARSGVPVRALSVFDGAFGKVQARLLGLPGGLLGTSPAGAALRDLRLSFSPCVPLVDYADPEPRVWEPGAQASDWYESTSAFARQDSNCGEVAVFLRRLPGLETLGLYMYNTLTAPPPSAYAKVFARIVRLEVRLPRLRRLVLRGIYVRSADLLRFLGAHPALEALDFRGVEITDEGWDPVLRFMSRMESLREVHLERLRDRSRRIVNLLPTDEKFDDGKRGTGYSTPLRRGGELVYTRDIGMEEVKAGLSFQAGGRGKFNRDTMQWLCDKYREYGPPTNSPAV